MIKTEETLYCDVCKNEVDEFIGGASEDDVITYSIQKHVYYGQTGKLDLCKKCYLEICRTIERLEADND